jgi:hypothetical protein
MNIHPISGSLSRSCNIIANLSSSSSHDRAGVWVLVVEHVGEVVVRPAELLLLLDAGHVAGLRAPDVARRGALVVGAGDVRLAHQAVGHVRPDLGLLPRRLRLLQHLAGLHVPDHRHLLLLPVDLHRLNP